MAAVFRLLVLLTLLPLGSAASAQAKRIAFSFDDAPRHAGAFFTPDARTRALIAALARGGVKQAAFFVTTGNIDRPGDAGGAERIAAYVAAGHVIANHSHSHLSLAATPAADYVADLDRAEAWLKGRPGYRPWYRYPYLNEGGRDIAKRDYLRGALAARGLRNGYVTIDNYDWYLDAISSAARRENKPMNMEALRDLYVETLADTADFYDRIAVSTVGRSPAHVLLLHETDLAALFVDDLAATLKLRGWEIITMDEAYRDPMAAVEPDTLFLGEGRVAALAQLAGRERGSLVHERTDEEVLNRLFEERVLLEQADLKQ